LINNSRELWEHTLVDFKEFLSSRHVHIEQLHR
jgi:hypothetical protein